MGKVDRLHNIVEPFAALFWALDIVLTLPAGLASLHHCTQSLFLYSHSWFNSQRSCVGLPPPFSYLGILFI